MSLIKKLEGANVVSFDLTCENKKLNIMECCDYHYQINLNKAEVKAFLIELESIYNSMED